MNFSADTSRHQKAPGDTMMTPIDPLSSIFIRLDSMLSGMTLTDSRIVLTLIDEALLTPLPFDSDADARRMLLLTEDKESTLDIHKVLLNNASKYGYENDPDAVY